jgi:hypothetical protein
MREASEKLSCNSIGAYAIDFRFFSIACLIADRGVVRHYFLSGDMEATASTQIAFAVVFRGTYSIIRADRRHLGLLSGQIPHSRFRLGQQLTILVFGLGPIGLTARLVAKIPVAVRQIRIEPLGLGGYLRYCQEPKP